MIFIQLQEQLEMLNNVLSQINNEQFCKPIQHLSGATIGQHSRHIIEMLNCAITGNQTGVVDYINRERNLALEQDKELALRLISNLKNNLPEKDKTFLLISGTDANTIQTTYHREIVYNTEHVTHHLALIKVALVDMELDFFPDNFGYSKSTLLYKASPPSHT